MDQQITETTNWPDLAIALDDRLTGRNAEITYEFHQMEIHVPSKVGDDAQHGKWLLNGSVVIRTRDTSRS